MFLEAISLAALSNICHLELDPVDKILFLVDKINNSKGINQLKLKSGQIQYYIYITIFNSTATNEFKTFINQLKVKYPKFYTRKFESKFSLKNFKFKNIFRDKQKFF